MTRLERLLAMVADRPEGQKVDIPAIVRAFTPTQDSIISGIQSLIDSSELDPVTLRRPIPNAKPSTGLRRGQSSDGVSSAQLWDEIEAERKRRGQSREAASLSIWGNKARIYSLRARGTARLETADKVRAWIRNETPAAPTKVAAAKPPAPRAAAEGGGAARCAEVPPPIDGLAISGKELVARIETYIASHKLSRSAVANRLFGSTGGIALLRFTKAPRPKTVSRILELLGSAPDQKLKSAAPLGDRRFGDNQPNIRGTSGKAREASSATGSPVAKRTTGRVSHEEPASAVAPSARARPVDIKVNTTRDWSKPPPGYVSRPEAAFKIAATKATPQRSRMVKEAQEHIDAGAGYGAPGSLRNTQIALERQMAEAARLADPIEQAKVVIQRAGWRCFSASVTGGPADHFYVGNKLLTKEQLLAEAERLTQLAADRAGRRRVG